MHIIDLCMCAYDRLYTVQNHIAWNVFWTISLLDPIHRGMFAKPRWMQEIKPRSIGTVQWGCWIWMGDGNDGIIWNYMELYGIIWNYSNGWSWMVCPTIPIPWIATPCCTQHWARPVISCPSWQDMDGFTCFTSPHRPTTFIQTWGTSTVKLSQRPTSDHLENDKPKFSKLERARWANLGAFRGMSWGYGTKIALV